MKDLDARLLARGLGIGRKPRPHHRFSPRLVFALGVLVGFVLARTMTLIIP